MILGENNDMIQALTPNSADNPLHIGILPRGTWSSDHFLDSKILNPLSKIFTIDRIPISDQILGNSFFRKSIHNLLGGPYCSRMGSYIEMYNLSSIMTKNDKAIQQPEVDRRNGERLYISM